MVAVAGAAQTLAVLPGMSESSPYAFSEDFALEGSEHCQQPSHRTTGRRGQVQRLGQRYEADAEMLQFLQSGEQIGDRSSPAVQPPHQHHIDLPAPRSFQQFSRNCRWVAPEPTSFTCMAMVQPRRTAYSRMARFCMGSVC
jgi:hypothetical protein